MLPHPLLLCDAGGTNLRFAMVREAGGEVEKLAELLTGNVGGLAAAANAAIAGSDLRPASMLVCAAGPVNGRTLKLTNAAWSIDGPELARAMDLQSGLLLNDFEALALSLKEFKPDWLRPIGGGVADPRGVKVVLGPGTGLGAAAMVSTGRRICALASEAGHVLLAPADPEQAALWPLLETPEGRLTAEAVLSGPGLERLYRARCRLLDRPAEALDAAHIVARALADHESAEAAVVRLFWRVTARVATNNALSFGARGGVVLAGGILPRIESLLDENEFRTLFEDAAPMQGLLASIPVSLLQRPDAVLHGMAAIARNPGNYVIDFASRDWAAEI